MKLLMLGDNDDLHRKSGIGKAKRVVSCGDVTDDFIPETAGISLIIAQKRSAFG